MEEEAAYLRRLPPSEVFNLVTHGVGALIALSGLAYLVRRADGALQTTAAAIYGISLVVLLCSSTLHHAIPPAPGRKEALRRLDHVAIYLLIMGTYAPPCLVALPPAWGLPLLAGVWTFGLVGIFLKMFRPFTARWVTIGMYVGMGWMAVIAAVPIYQLTPAPGLALLAGGGIVYTLGAFVYAAKKPDLWPRYVGFHGLWHVFVLVAAAMHYAFIARYVMA